MKSRRDRLVLAAVLLGVAALAGCGLDPPKAPPPFDCNDYDMASSTFPVTCAEDAGDIVDEDAGTDEDLGDEDLGDEDLGDIDAGDVDAGP